jgi:2-polyprenyl-6-hydroxyphenyl methylase/3-demethylubiquinone-9 3-methyltransferase
LNTQTHDTEKTEQGRTWDHSSNEEFLSYYAEQSLGARTLERSTALRDMLLRALGPQRAAQPLDVADVGCGAGALSQVWAELGHRVRGLDVNEPLVEIGRQRAAERKLEIEFCVGSAVELPWPDESIDVCILPELLEHVAEWEPCLDEGTRVLRPGGVLYVSTTNKLCPRQEEFDLPLYSWYPSWLKRRYERLAVTTRPELANHAKYPAVNWFTFYSLRDALARRGLDSRDRFDLMDLTNKTPLQRSIVQLMRSVPPLRWLGHVATSYTVVVAIKR